MQKKKIIIFSSSGGGGHISAAEALKEYLEDEYYIETKQIFDEVLGILDPLKLFSFSKSNGEKVYSYLLQKKWTFIINCMYVCARWSLYLERLIVKKILSDYLTTQKPDLVISVVPLVNYLLEEVCVKLSIPFILCPTDLDVATFIDHMKLNSRATANICLSFNDPAILAAFYKERIPMQSLQLTGFPLRSAFFKDYDKNSIHQDFNIPFGKPIILLLMGAVGSKATYSYVRQLAQLNIPVHLLICLGKNEKMRKKLEKITLPNHITLSIISYTDRIAELMSLATVCITKSGSVSVCETIYKEIPMILDATSRPLVWEKFNLSFIKEHGFGEVVYHVTELNSIIECMLVDKEYFDSLKNNLRNFEKVHFGAVIQDLVKAMI